MIIATTETIAGHRVVTTLGQVFGVVVRSRGIGGNIMAGLRSIVGGEIHECTQLLEEARRHAVDRLVANATAMGANAVIMMRFNSAEIGQTMSEIVAYGTAVVLEPVPASHAAPYRTGAGRCAADGGRDRHRLRRARAAAVASRGGRHHHAGPCSSA